jgi:hypothetical protein
MPKAEDFVCSPLLKSSPLGAVNAYAPDCTFIYNMIQCTCPECGGKNKMEVYWPYPSSLMNYAEQGIRPIPEECFKNGWNGGKPLIPAEPNVAFKNGYLVREPGGCETVACWTTCSNHARLMGNRSRVARLRIEGETAKGLGVADGVTNLDNQFKKQNIMPFTEEEIISGGQRIPKQPLNIQLP